MRDKQTPKDVCGEATPTLDTLLSLLSLTFPVGNQKSHIHTIQISDQTIIFRTLPLCVMLWSLNGLKTNQREELTDQGSNKFAISRHLNYSRSYVVYVAFKCLM